MGRIVAPIATITCAPALVERRPADGDASPAVTAHLNFTGYQVFASRHAMRARPL
jgi:hypothetical protein